MIVNLVFLWMYLAGSFLTIAIAGFVNLERDQEEISARQAAWAALWPFIPLAFIGHLVFEWWSKPN